MMWLTALYNNWLSVQLQPRSLLAFLHELQALVARFQ